MTVPHFHGRAAVGGGLDRHALGRGRVERPADEAVPLLLRVLHGCAVVRAAQPARRQLVDDGRIRVLVAVGADHDDAGQLRRREWLAEERRP